MYSRDLRWIPHFHWVCIAGSFADLTSSYPTRLVGPVTLSVTLSYIHNLKEDIPMTTSTSLLDQRRDGKWCRQNCYMTGDTDTLNAWFGLSTIPSPAHLLSNSPGYCHVGHILVCLPFWLFSTDRIYAFEVFTHKLYFAAGWHFLFLENLNWTLIY